MTPGQSGFDESVYLLLAPYYHLVAGYWRNFQLPLWNPYCGWGLPLLGDIQAAVFSPFRLAFALNPSMYQYNFLLVLEVALAAAGAYLLARQMNVSRAAAFFSATTYGFCPYILYFLELISGTSSVLLPWLFWFFIKLKRQPSMRSALACAFFISVYIASGHPEASFIGVAFATLCLNMLFALRKEIGTGLRWTATIAPIAFCLSAPLIIPFAEYLFHSDCYKFVRPAGENPPVQALLLNLLQPVYHGASPYLGVAGIAFCALAFFVQGERRSYVLALLTGIAIAFICVCRPLLFGWLFDVTHLSIVPGTYCIPVFLLQLTLLAAFGFDFCTEQLKIGSNKAFAVFCLALILTCFLPAVLEICGFSFKSGNFDNGVADMAFNSKIWITTMVLSVLVCVVLLLKKYLKPPAVGICAALIILSFSSLAMANRWSLPIEPPFRYDLVDPLPFLIEKKERILTLGFDVLCPNTNAVYRIASIGTHNVMQPSRYKDFIVAAGARNTRFNTLVESLPLSRLIDFAGVKYVLSLGAVFGQDDKEPQFADVKLPRAVEFVDTPEIKVKAACVAYDERKAEVRGILTFAIENAPAQRFTYIAQISDEKGIPFWFGGIMPLCDRTKSGKTHFSALVPSDLKRSEKFFIGVQIFDSERKRFLTPDARSLTTIRAFGSFIALAEKQFSPPDKRADDLHYRLVSESGPHHVRVYENTKTLGRAYLVFSGIPAGSGDDALKLISAKNFDGFSTVVLEGKDVKTEARSKTGMSVPIQVDSPDRLEMTVDCPQGGYLVLTDTFFPGWQATVDGKSAEILRANYLFRAVPVDAGQHKVVFTYRPLSFTLAFLLFVAGLLSAVVFGLRKQPKNDDKKDKLIT